MFFNVLFVLMMFVWLDLDYFFILLADLDYRQIVIFLRYWLWFALASIILFFYFSCNIFWITASYFVLSRIRIGH